MKKLIKITVLFVILFGYTPNVFASTVTWKQITDKWKALPEDELVADVTSTDTNLKIKDRDSNYEVNFSYNNGVITMVRQEETPLSLNEKLVREYGNAAMIAYMVDIIAELYEVDLSKLEESNLENYGIVIVTEEVEEENDDFSFSGEFIKSFSINLDTFEEKTKSLQGTYNSAVETPDSLEFEEPSVNLKIGKSYSNSLDLIVNVNNLPETSSAKCEIYLIPDAGTAYQTGESYVIGTINDCKNGNNSYKISNLKENSKYTFQVVLTEELSLGINNQILGEKYMTFATIASSNEQNNNSVDATGNILNNPKTSTLAFIITISSSIISATAFILLFLKSQRKRQEV